MRLDAFYLKPRIVFVTAHSIYCIPSDAKCPLCRYAGYLDYHPSNDGHVSCNCCEQCWTASEEELALIIEGMSSDDRMTVMGAERHQPISMVPRAC
jgi:hypothetical protein